MIIFKKKYVYNLLAITILPFFSVTPVNALDFIPGLKGFGTDTRGPFELANDPDICIVTSTRVIGGSPSADTRNGVSVKVGTFQQCVEYAPEANTGKIILFETSGTINETGSEQEYRVTGNTYIAGQSAPSPGVTLRGVGLGIKDVTDIIVQHLRIRYGNESGGVPDWNESAIRITADSVKKNQDIIIDHCSLSWSDDGNIDIYTKGPRATNDNITIANNIINEGIDNEGDMSKGMSLSAYDGGSYTKGVTNYIALNNIIATNEYRSPQVLGTSLVYINNLLYNIEDQVFNYVGGKTNVYQRSTLVANVVKGGPSSGTYASKKILVFGTLSCDNWKQPLSSHKIYLYGNSSDAGTQSDSGDWAMVDWSRGANCDISMRVTGETPSVYAPDWPTGATFMAASLVEDYVKSHAGARPADRDSVDECIVLDITNETGTQLDGTASKAGSCGATTGSDAPWPTLAENTRTLVIPSRPFADDDSDGYSNIEEWLHSQAAKVEGGGVTYFSLPPVVVEDPMLSPPQQLEVL